MLSPAFLSKLRSLLPAHCVLNEREDLLPFESDGLAAYRNIPDVVVLPENETQVAAILRLCHENQVAVVARGAGTGLAAGALPVDGAVLLVLAKPGSITPHTHFVAEVYVLSKDEGGRHTPFFNGYRPQFYFRTTDVTGACELPAGVEMVMPGDNVQMTVKLIAPIAMEDGLRFAIREGGRTVGAGVVAKIVE